jgi:hypothetical protein
MRHISLDTVVQCGGQSAGCRGLTKQAA